MMISSLIFAALAASAAPPTRSRRLFKTAVFMQLVGHAMAEDANPILASLVPI
jgi:hypothetical protein